MLTKKTGFISSVPAHVKMTDFLTVSYTSTLSVVEFVSHVTARDVRGCFRTVHNVGRSRLSLSHSLQIITLRVSL